MKPMMRKKIVLVVEDDEPKQRSIVGFLSDTLKPGFAVRTAESLSGAIDVLSNNEVMLAVVDMSLPTFDFVKDRRGGCQPQGFGGADILRFVDSETTETRSVILTQYEEFILERNGEQRDQRGLDALLREELDQRFLGVVHYEGQYGAWRNKLREVLVDLDMVKEE